ncbi:hypothetical protein CS022_01780 [Veronia nyctiphanis]|uniref:Uncharacterized protein n=2 Tax=Veronia nyctiphanis TaxID=1278244 RepID=A0A4Q0YUG9_9GAMM|nr:hypothetical protein CS022_01780 [Veronia nyctiphanis]
MSMRIDLLLRKFGFKGDQEDSSPIEDTMQTIFEQLNELEIVWEDSSIGWLLLLTEQLHDTEAFNRLVAVVKAEVAADPDFSCFRDDEALSAIIITAINEATNLKGQMCMECCGSGEIDHGDNTETCPKCKDGYLPWTDERRYELFVQLYSSPYSNLPDTSR